MAQGYRFVKGGWGHDLSIAFGRDEARDLAVARAVRDGGRARHRDHPGRRGARRLGRAHAIRMCRASSTTRSRLYWFEDPLPEQDIDGYRRLHAAVGTRICTGEKGWHAAHYRSLIESGAVDVIMVDPGKAEGVTGTWAIIEMAAAAGRRGTRTPGAARSTPPPSLHMAVAAAEHARLRAQALPSPMQHELVRVPIEQKDGWVAPPEAPGLGVEVDESVVRRYRFTEDDLGR